MDDVAKKIGVSKGALYLYFASKEELFEAICRTEPLALRDILYSTFSESKNPLESASEFFEKMVSRYGSNPALSFEILSEASHNPDSDECSRRRRINMQIPWKVFWNKLERRETLGRVLTFGLLPML